MADSEPTSTDTSNVAGTPYTTVESQDAAHSSGAVDETNPGMTEPKRNSDIMTSSQFREAERKRNGQVASERKKPDAAEAERREAKLREMELIDKNRAMALPAKKGTNWGPILLILGLIVVIALLWSWFA